jgi:hypothetical protein
MKQDSVFCAACGREFALPLIAMVRRQHGWCDLCIEIADRKLQEAAQRAARRDPTSELVQRRKT